MDQLITQVKELLANTPVRWAVCGGYALELFLGRDLRRHGDIDICVFEQDRDALCRHMLQAGWAVYEFRGQGLLRPIYPATASEPGRNLMCVKPGCDLVSFYPGDDTGLLYYQFYHKGIVELNYLELLFNREQDGCFVSGLHGSVKRELEKAVLFRDGVPYLAPEVALLFKASQMENEAYKSDFQAVFPCLNDEQRQWFLANFEILFPGEHYTPLT